MVCMWKLYAGGASWVFDPTSTLLGKQPEFVCNSRSELFIQIGTGFTSLIATVASADRD